MTPSSAKSWSLSDFLEIELLGLKELEMDSVVLNLAIVHVTVLIHPKTNDF